MSTWTNPETGTRINSTRRTVTTETVIQRLGQILCRCGFEGESCKACGSAAVVAELPAPGLWWPGPVDEPVVDDASDYGYERDRDRREGVSY